MIERLQRCEERVLAAVAGSIPDSVVPAARVLTELGGVPQVWSCVLGVAALAAVRRRSLAAFFAPVGTLAAAAGLRRLIAELLGRPRPPQRYWHAEWSGPSFPSRHTTLATLGAGLVVDTTVRCRLFRGPVLVIGGVVGVSRIVLGVHWPSDVLGGWAFGWLALVLSRRWRVNPAQIGHAGSAAPSGWLPCGVPYAGVVWRSVPNMCRYRSWP
jgi:membrane-associated phospholipid phosphatase